MGALCVKADGEVVQGSRVAAVDIWHEDNGMLLAKVEPTDPPRDAILYAVVASWESKAALAAVTSRWTESSTCRDIVKERILPTLESATSATPTLHVVRHMNIYICHSSWPSGFAVCHVCTQGFPVEASALFQHEIAQLLDKGKHSAALPLPSFQQPLKDLTNIFSLKDMAPKRGGLHLQPVVEEHTLAAAADYGSVEVVVDIEPYVVSLSSSMAGHFVQDHIRAVELDSP